MGYDRFKKPDEGAAFESEYDIPSDELQDLIQRQPAGVSVKMIDIGTAAGTMVINEPGYGFVMYGYTSGSGAKYSEAYIGVAINSDGTDQTQVFPCKTGRGFRGSFSKLTLTWPIDPNSSANRVHFIIFKSKKLPWMGGEEAQ